MKKIYTLLSIFLFCTMVSLNAQMAHVPNELLVQFKPGTDPEKVIDDYRTLGNMETGLTLGKLLSKTMNIYRLHYNDSQISGREMLMTLQNDRAVSIAQYNHYVFPRETLPDDPQFGSQWHHNNTGQTNGTEGSDIGSGLAWDITTGGVTALGDTIVVCVIEGGNLNHPDLTDNAWVNYGEIPDNGIDDDENGYVDDYFGWNVQSESDAGVFEGGHGTQVMGMIGAKGGNDLGVVGANWDIKIMSVAGESASNEASVVEAYNYALVQRQMYDTSNGASGAFVVATNASWGIDNGNPDDVPIWSAFYDTLGTYGILNCGATANNNVDIDVVGDIPTAAPSDYMISVTATNDDDVRTFSAYGATTVDLGAPGENVFTTSGNSGYGSTSGTSFASPLTAGVIGLLYSVPCESFAQLVRDDPQGAADYVRLALFQGVDPVPNLTGQTVTGGRLNAFNSLTIMLANCGEDLCLAPFGFDYSVSNDTVYSFDWTVFGGGEATIRFREVGAEEWNLMEGIVEGPFIVDSLPLCTPYEFQIAATCSEEDGELSFGESTLIETLGCCVATTEVLTADTTEMSVALSWEHGFNIEAYEVYYRVEGTTTWILLGTFEDGEADLEGLEGCTYYDILVKPACAEDFEEGVETTIRTKDCGICLDNLYCPSMGENTSDEYIDEVEIGGYSNQSGNDGGYALFEDTELELVPGETYEVNLSPGFTGSNFNEFFRVWIDLNQDGEFTNDEVMMSSEDASAQPVSDSISIPQDALPGSTRLRVVMKWMGFGSSEPAACATVVYGETEDYCITIADSVVTSTTNQNFTRFAVYPNPGNGIFHFDYDLISGKGNNNVILRVFDISGKQVRQTLFNGPRNTLDIQGLEDGMYFYHMAAANGEVLNTGKLLLVR